MIMKKNNLARRNVRNSKQSLVESIMAKVAPIVKNAVNENLDGFEGIQRIAIIDHDNHELFIEDINLKILREEYHDSEEEYINANFDVSNYSWDYIGFAYYIPDNLSTDYYDDPIEIDFEKLI